jgi:uncharacterized protein YjbI with pentapeptide repeats
VDFSGANLKGAILSRANMKAANLRSADLNGANLNHACLKDANLYDADLQKCNLEGVNMKEANLIFANLENADLRCAHLENADIRSSRLVRAHLYEANLKGANLDMANLQSAFLQGSNLQGAFIPLAHLEGADLIQANLQDAHLVGANLQGTILREANLEGANFETATVDGGTLIWNCKVSRYSKNKSFTNFEGVGLDSARIDPGTKQLLEYNIRRKNWEEWYRKHSVLRWPVRVFWAMSDYGMSTVRVVGVFFILAFLFAAVYANWAYWAPPGIVNDFSVEAHEPIWHYFVLSVVRPVYFSVVTMTTLGFGDMYANKESIAGHVLLILQVILGYVLLGALVTRFAVLFTAGGPAGKFADEKKTQSVANLEE